MIQRESVAHVILATTSRSTLSAILPHVVAGARAASVIMRLPTYWASRVGVRTRFRIRLPLCQNVHTSTYGTRRITRYRVSGLTKMPMLLIWPLVAEPPFDYARQSESDWQLYSGLTLFGTSLPCNNSHSSVVDLEDPAKDKRFSRRGTCYPHLHVSVIHEKSRRSDPSCPADCLSRVQHPMHSKTLVQQFSIPTR